MSISALVQCNFDNPRKRTEALIAHGIPQPRGGNHFLNGLPLQAGNLLEYRDRTASDSGLDLYGQDLARQAVVAHTLADTPNDGVCCWYRGRILVPLEADSDLQVTSTSLVIRLVGEDVSAGYVDLEIATSSSRGIDVVTSGSHAVIASTGTQTMSTPCGDVITWGTWSMQSFYEYRPSTYGYGGQGSPDVVSPVIKWSIGGITPPAESGQLDVPTPDGTFTVEYNIHPLTFQLTLISRGGERYNIPLVATATEPGGGLGTTATATFAPLGYYIGFQPGDAAKLERCMSKYLRSVRLRPRDLLIPPGPDPYRQQWRDRINQSRLQQVAKSLARSKPGHAVALNALITMRYAHFGEPAVNRRSSALPWLAAGLMGLVAVAATVLPVRGRR